MTDPFDAFDSNLTGAADTLTTTATTTATSGFEDPAAAFLAREEAELAKIESNGNELATDDGFGDFGIPSLIINFSL